MSLAADLGRAGYAACTRFVVPVVTGALVFHLYTPKRVITYPLFACSARLATVDPQPAVEWTGLALICAERAM